MLGLCVLYFVTGCSGAPKPFVRTETVTVQVPVVTKPPAELLAPCGPEVFLDPSRLTVGELAQWAEDLAITIEAVCNANTDALRQFYATH